MSRAIRQFYGAHARLYDWLARHTPGVGRWRTAAVDALDLDPGDTVVDVGCGTGASFPYLRDRVGATGTVIGIDATRPLLSYAARTAEPWENVTVIAADGTDLPIDERVDAVLGSFVVGLFEDPTTVVHHWRDHLTDGGRIALLDGVPTGWAPPLDWVFAQFVRIGAPPESRSAVVDRLTRRVEAGHGTLHTHGTRPVRTTFLGGIIRITAATPTPDSPDPRQITD